MNPKTPQHLKDDAEAAGIEELEAAATMFDDLASGEHYKKQEASGYTIRYIALAAVLMLSGCKGVDRLINGGDQEPQQPSPGVISSNPISPEPPEFNIETPEGFTLKKWHGVMPSGAAVTIDAVEGSTVAVFIEDAGFWFKLRTTPSGAYWYSRTALGTIQYSGQWVASKEYCIYQYLPK